MSYKKGGNKPSVSVGGTTKPHVGGSEEVPRLVESVGGSEVPKLVENVGIIGGDCGTDKCGQQPTVFGGSANGGAEWAQQVYGGPSQQVATPGGSNLVNMAHVSNCGVQAGGKRRKGSKKRRSGKRRGGFGLTEVAVPGVLLAANYMMGRRSKEPFVTRRRRGGSKKRRGSRRR